MRDQPEPKCVFVGYAKGGTPMCVVKDALIPRTIDIARHVESVHAGMMVKIEIFVTALDGTIIEVMPSE